MADFIHHFEKGDTSRPALLVLHGTGGNEHDLLSLAQQIAPNASLLSPRGKVLENGMPRFFKRFPDGTFDKEDLIARTHELAEFIQESAKKYDLDLGNLYAFGYSNGANIAASLLLLHPDVLAGGILLRAMLPLTPPVIPSLKDKQILMLSGLMDPIATPEIGQSLATLFQQSGADISYKTRLSGHGLEMEDVVEAKKWFEKL